MRDRTKVIRYVSSRKRRRRRRIHGECEGTRGRGGFNCRSHEQRGGSCLLSEIILVCLTMSVRPRRPCTVIRGATMEPRYPWRRDRIDCCYQVFQNMQRDGAEAPLTLIRFSRHRLDYRLRASPSSRSTSLWHMFD
jgi:hypothetical protein